MCKHVQYERQQHFRDHHNPVIRLEDNIYIHIGDSWEITEFLGKEFGLPTTPVSGFKVFLFPITADGLYQIAEDAI